MNAIQSKQRIDFYINLTAAARFTFAQYNLAMNDAVNEFINQQVGDEDNRDPKNVQWIQPIRDNLYTLIKTGALTITNGTAVTSPYYSSIPSHGNYPADYDTFLYLAATVSSVTVYARPTSYNEIGPLLQDSFKFPSNLRPYYVEDSTGLTIYRGSSGTMTANITYIKQPTDFSIGSETQLIDGGPAVTLTNLSTYYATQISIYNGVTYQIGSTIAGVTALLLTSGQVILASNTSPIDLPAKVHERLAKSCARKLLNSIGLFEAAAATEHEEGKL